MALHQHAHFAVDPAATGDIPSIALLLMEQQRRFDEKEKLLMEERQRLIDKEERLMAMAMEKETMLLERIAKSEQQMQQRGCSFLSFGV